MEVRNLLDIHINNKTVISVVGGGGKTSLVFRLTEEFVSLGKKVIVATTTHMAYEPDRPFAEDGETVKVRRNLEEYGYTVAASKMTGESIPKIRSLPDGCLQKLRSECDVMILEADGAKGLPLKVPADWEPVIPEMTDIVIGVMGLDCLGKKIKDTVHRPELAAQLLEKSIEDRVTEEDLLKIAGSPLGMKKNVGNREYRVFLNKRDLVSDPQILDGIIESLKKEKIHAACQSLKYGFGKKIAIVILAAGNSRRFGKNKLLYTVEGEPLFFNALHKAVQIQRRMKADISSVVVVTQYSEIQKQAEKLGAKVIWNPLPQEGIASSMRLGLQEACRDGEQDAYLFMVADQPWLTVESLERLIKCYRTSDKGMAAVSIKGEPGNPCIFSRKYYSDLMKLTGDRGGKRVLKAHLEDVVLYEIKNEKELTDVDKPL